MSAKKKATKASSSKFSSPYAEAASMLNQIWEHQKGLKSVVYHPKSGQLRCSKHSYAQVCQVLKHKSLLDRVLKETSDKSLKDVSNQGLLFVLLHELLLGPNKKIRGGGVVKRKLTEKEDDLRECLRSCQLQDEKAGEGGDEFPRYVRVNTLWPDTSIDQVVQELQRHCLAEGQVCYRDKHVPNLLVLPDLSSKLVTKLKQNTYLSPHRVVLQDKSSCLSAMCMMDGFKDASKRGATGDERVYLDACAAPGNKTSHLAALIQNETAAAVDKPKISKKKKQAKKAGATLIALDRSKERCATLETRMRQLLPGSTVNLVVKCEDFLQTPVPDDKAILSKTTDILLDPSCSGSGICTSLDRIDETGDDEVDRDEQDAEKRLEHLATFQLKALKHAMTAFPQAERIVYSTCSIHAQENEEVVAQALSACRSGGWELVAPVCMNNWPCRGHACEGLSEKESNCLIRVTGREHETNGFFIACFRKQSEEATGRAENETVAAESSADAAWLSLPVYPGREGMDAAAKPDQPQRDLGKSTMPKNIAKKLLWKQRQREAKEERLKKKRQKEAKEAKEERLKKKKRSK